MAVPPPLVTSRLATAGGMDSVALVSTLGAFVMSPDAREASGAKVAPPSLAVVGTMVDVTDIMVDGASVASMPVGGTGAVVGVMLMLLLLQSEQVSDPATLQS